MPCVCDVDRERPKYQIKEDADTMRNGLKAMGDTSDTVKVNRNLIDETVRARWAYFLLLFSEFDVLIVQVDLLPTFFFFAIWRKTN